MLKINIRRALIIGSIVFSLCISIYGRLIDLPLITNNKTMIDPYLVIKSNDSFRWFKLAKEYKAGNFGTGKNTGWDYPLLSIKLPEKPDMLTFLISKFSKFTNNDHKTAGIYLSILLSGLFTIPLIIYANILCISPAGLTGALLGSFSYAYYNRSCAGYVDTDTLNLFFLLLMSLLVLLIGHNKDNRTSYIYAALSGISMLGFYFWYGRLGFAAVYFLVMVIYFYLKGISIKKTFILLGLFILFMNPSYFVASLYDLYGFITTSEYIHFSWVSIAEASSSVSFLETVSETKKITREIFFRNLMGNEVAGIISIIGFFLLCLYKKIDIVPLLPLILLGGLSFISGARFIMYFAPLAGLGLGFLVFTIIKYLFSSYFDGKSTLKSKDMYVELTSFIIIILFFFISAEKLHAYGTKKSNYVISQETLAGILALKNIVPKGSPIYAWWDMGYIYTEIGDFYVYHAGAQNMFTNAIAKSFIVHDQQYLYKYISSIDNGIFAIDNIMDYKDKAKKKNIVIFYTYDMIFKYGNFTLLVNNKPDGIKPINCFIPFFINKLQCEGILIDIDNGLLNNKPLLKRFIMVNKNGVLEKKEFKTGRFTAQFLLRDNNIFAFLVSENTYHSNFNQMYLLGNYDKKLFEQIYNDYPYVRAFKLLQ